jgi:hypothetical protein
MSAPLEAGAQLPAWQLPVTPTLVVSTAIATRDFQDVHHDRDLAHQKGSKDIFLNILTTTGLVERYVTDWAGADVLVRGVKIRLGVPAYPYDALTFTGSVRERVADGQDDKGDDTGEERWLVDVQGANSLGNHVTGTVTIAVPQETAQ